MSSLAAMMASGLGVAPRQFSVTVRPLSRLNSPVCWQATLISGWLSMMLCRPLERSMAGEAPGVPSSSKIDGALGEEFEQRLALLLAAQDVVGADVRQGVDAGRPCGRR